MESHVCCIRRVPLPWYQKILRQGTLNLLGVPKFAKSKLKKEIPGSKIYLIIMKTAGSRALIPTSRFRVGRAEQRCWASPSRSIKKVQRTRISREMKSRHKINRRLAGG